MGISNKTWKNINNILGRSKTYQNKVFKFESRYTDDPHTISNKFNDYFANVATAVANDLGPSDASFEDYLPPRHANDIPWELTNFNEIRQIVNKLRDVKAGPDGIPMAVIKKNIDVLGPVLCSIFNKSLTSGIFPKIHKKGIIVPIYKNKDAFDVSNYRPISLLNAVSKILEKIVAKRIISHLESNDLLSNSQFAYRKARGTDLATAKFVGDVLRNFDNNNYTCSIFLDLTKAFDCVCHNILATKLNHLGINDTAHKWLTDYLSDRIQCVKFDGCISNEKIVSIGVLQGSILGPILFLIYINDIQRAGQTGELLLFADDGNYYENSEDYSELINSVNNNLKYLIKWFVANRLAVNIIKTEAMLFSRKILYFPLQPIMLNETPISFNFTFKFLGLHLDFKLNWKFHIKFLCSKLSSVCGVLFRIRNKITQSIAKILYYSIVYPHINYCNIVWGSCYPSATQKLFIIQKKIVRLITYSNRWTPSSPLFSQLKVIKLPDIIKLNTALFVYKSINSLIPSPIQFQIRVVEGYNLRIQNTIEIRIFHSRQTELFIHVRGAKLWNEIPYEIRNTASIFSFKKCLNNMYLTSYT